MHTFAGLQNLLSSSTMISVQELLLFPKAIISIHFIYLLCLADIGLHSIKTCIFFGLLSKSFYLLNISVFVVSAFNGICRPCQLNSSDEIHADMEEEEGSDDYIYN